MTEDLLPKDSYKLLALAEEIANALGGDREEAPLRASIALARFTRDAYRAIRECAAESPEADRFLVPARVARSKAEQQLRRRLTRHIAALCRLMDDQSLIGVANYVLAISA